MRKPIKYVEKAAVAAAKGAWVVFDRLNRINPGVSPTPKWSDKPLLKSYEKSKPPLGWPRSTDSLCPKCVPEIRRQTAARSFDERKNWRDQSHHCRERWKDLDGQRLPRPWPLRRCDVDRHRFLEASRRRFPRTRHRRAQ